MKIPGKLLPVFLSIILFSCDKDDDPTGPTPIPSFTQDRLVIEAGETITFTNTSTDAAAYLWNFGDGGTSTAENPNYTYAATGTYDIVLTATGSGGISQTATASVVVGQRYAVAIGIVSINFENANSEPWDDDSGPDVLFGFAKVTDTSISLFDLGEDYVAEDFPVGGELEPDSQTLLTNEDWSFIFIDNDEPMDELNLENQDAVMFYTELNPTTIASEKDYETGEGYFTVNEFGFEFTIGFQVR